jgi:nucleoside-diphosphate-sugar epimerase
MHILVTGGSGLIGQHCIEGLSKAGHTVTGTFSSGNGPSVEGKWVKVDLLNAEQRAKLIESENPEVLVHLAWDVRNWDGPDQQEWFEASEDLIRRFQQQGGQQLFTAGTSMEYAWNGLVCRENNGLFESSTAYGRAKHALWKFAETFSAKHQLTYTHGRIFFLCGPGQEETRLVPAIIHALLKNERFCCKSGHLFRDYLDVRDVAKFINALIETKQAGDYNIASGVPTKVADLVAAIGTELGRSDLIDFTSAPAEPPLDLTVVADVDKLSQALGYVPEFDLNKSVLDTIAWIKELSSN